ncbi:hypothetical protein IGI66_003550 [Enterococcus sp. AZ048]|uniref:hypothetical protein n=1 Tax=Enterococcus sp. AZ048 TaxID=2774658 RepID=UPI003F221524
MTEALLTHRQLFSMTPKNLEKRISEHYYQTQNSNLTIQYALALRVRCTLGAQEFKHILRDLIRELFLTTKATRTMKRFFYYFQDYFMAPEWRSLKLRVFPLRNFGEKAVTLVHSLISTIRPDETNEP